MPPSQQQTAACRVNSTREGVLRPTLGSARCTRERLSTMARHAAPHSAFVNWKRRGTRRREIHRSRPLLLSPHLPDCLTDRVKARTVRAIEHARQAPTFGSAHAWKRPCTATARGHPPGLRQSVTTTHSEFADYDRSTGGRGRCGAAWPSAPAPWGPSADPPAAETCVVRGYRSKYEC